MVDQTHKGIILKQTREAKGLSLQAVHEATKIPMDALKAIEEGYTVRTLSSFYQKGFMKMYAKYLDIDVKTVVDDYHPEELPRPIKDRKEDAVKFKVSDLFTPSRIQGILRFLIIIGVLFAFIRVVGCFANMVKGRSKKIAAAKAKEAPSKTKEEAKKKEARRRIDTKRGEAKKKTETQSRQAVAADKGVSGLAEKVKKRINLSVRAKRSSWLQVKVDGVVVFQSVFKRGVVETWSADKTIELAGKNIHELEFELNGKMIGSLGRGDRRARKVVVTKSGLKVKE